MVLLLAISYPFLALIGRIVHPGNSSIVYIDPAQIIPGCPDDTRCSIACQEDPRFKTTGSCVGPDRTLCSCEPPYNTTDLPMNTDFCNVQQCERRCERLGPSVIGKCIIGVCKCGYKTGELPPSDDGCTPNNCYDHCFIGLFPPLIYYCSGNECRCGWFF
ncbi:unnamed protein product [Larinioides sclopetarius]|uniref:Defensin-like protein n=1 Tax=Larinioides sclopetarius TaxID=280406 RepID=A0AAV2BGY0_9ARAC